MKIIIGKIYADWCGHCQTLEPEWNKIKKMMKKNKNIEMIEIEEKNQTKLDILKNQFPELQVNGYPTIFKIRPNRHIEYYTGNRNAIDMKKWIIDKNRSTKKRFRKRKHNKTKNSKNYIV